MAYDVLPLLQLNAGEIAMRNMPRSKLSASILALAAGAVVVFAHAQTTGSSAPATTGADSTFIQKASEGGLAEVSLSQLAVDNASSPEVRKFAQHMVRDHTENNLQLSTIAAHENIATSRILSSDHSALRDHLATLHGSSFDSAYIAAMREDHQKMEGLLKSSAVIVTTQELHTFINKTLPVVQDHLQMANGLAAK